MRYIKSKRRVRNGYEFSKSSSLFITCSRRTVKGMSGYHNLEFLRLITHNSFIDFEKNSLEDPWVGTSTGKEGDLYRDNPKEERDCLGTRVFY